jgi:hypothetical protein
MLVGSGSRSARGWEALPSHILCAVRRRWAFAASRGASPPTGLGGVEAPFSSCARPWSASADVTGSGQPAGSCTVRRLPWLASLGISVGAMLGGATVVAWDVVALRDSGVSAVQGCAGQWSAMRGMVVVSAPGVSLADWWRRLSFLVASSRRSTLPLLLGQGLRRKS